ncbi:hypothetical protein B0H17DRAFT_1086796 [Mycena rosella]|uniref:Uncharacterized protein n=1 Tax=Mycena rosella TaxID=1033263 RepID=A0AAD7G5U6_MYCRO|nr:hypothetical protein B0H17DRAFT_1086796 [Mycena rosella]
MGVQPQDDGAWPERASQEFRERLEEANNVLRQHRRSEGPVSGAGAAAAAPVRAIKLEPTDAPMPALGTVSDAGVAKQEDGGIPKLPSIKPEPEDAPIPPPRAPNKRMDPFELDATPCGVKHEDGQEIKPLAKPEPMDVPMPRPHALNKCMDPFEPEGTPSIGVKQEAGRESTARHLNPPSAYLRAPTPRIKQEEPRQKSSSGRRESGYGGNLVAPAPTAFSRGYSDPSPTNRNSCYSNRQTPAPHNYSGPPREGTRGYSRQPSRTFSPPPHPMKREWDADNDSRPYRPTNEPPRERSESTDIRFNYLANRDPWMRTGFGDQRKRGT